MQTAKRTWQTRRKLPKMDQSSARPRTARSTHLREQPALSLRPVRNFGAFRTFPGVDLPRIVILSALGKHTSSGFTIMRTHRGPPRRLLVRLLAIVGSY